MAVPVRKPFRFFTRDKRPHIKMPGQDKLTQDCRRKKGGILKVPHVICSTQEELSYHVVFMYIYIKYTEHKYVVNSGVHCLYAHNISYASYEANCMF